MQYHNGKLNGSSHMTSITIIATWITGSCISAELIGYWLHRLMHSGAIQFLSRNHMKHHLALYGPLQEQRSREYHDATNDSLSLGNIGLEWLVPAAIFLGGAEAIFHAARVLPLYQVIYFVSSLGWSFLTFSYLHDAMHVEGIWLERNSWLRRWFISARRRHDAHHVMINDEGLMDRNFGIGMFLFDRVFGTLSDRAVPFNERGYAAAQERFRSVLDGPLR
jgi:sterol desaturase/sphingolipid hydroxylase (fatty acid hydroxylase superfamily)